MITYCPLPTNPFSMASSSWREAESSSVCGVPLTICTGRRAGGVEECWWSWASAAVLLRDGVMVLEREELLLPVVRGVVVLLERGVPLLCGWMSVFQTCTNMSTVETCLLCGSLLNVDLDQSKLCRGIPLTSRLWMLPVEGGVNPFKKILLSNYLKLYSTLW